MIIEEPEEAAFRTKLEVPQDNHISAGTLIETRMMAIGLNVLDELDEPSRNLESLSLLLVRPRPESLLKVLPNTEKEDTPPASILETSSRTRLQRPGTNSCFSKAATSPRPTSSGQFELFPDFLWNPWAPAAEAVCPG